MKLRISTGLLAAALFAGGGAAFAQGAPTQSGDASSTTQQAGQGQSGATSLEGQGVIQSVNGKKHALTLIVPEDVSTTYRQAGGFAELSRQLDMASLSVPVAKDAQVQVDGQPASFKQLKMGDSVRVSFDPHQKKIVRIDATSMQAQPQHGGMMQNGGMQPGTMQNGGTQPGASGQAGSTAQPDTQPVQPSGAGSR